MLQSMHSYDLRKTTEYFNIIFAAAFCLHWLPS